MVSSSRSRRIYISACSKMRATSFSLGPAMMRAIELFLVAAGLHLVRTGGYGIGEVLGILFQAGPVTAIGSNRVHDELLDGTLPEGSQVLEKISVRLSEGDGELDRFVILRVFFRSEL